MGYSSETCLGEVVVFSFINFFFSFTIQIHPLPIMKFLFLYITSISWRRRINSAKLNGNTKLDPLPKLKNRVWYVCQPDSAKSLSITGILRCGYQKAICSFSYSSFVLFRWMKLKEVKNQFEHVLLFIFLRLLGPIPKHFLFFS